MFQEEQHIITLYLGTYLLFFHVVLMFFDFLKSFQSFCEERKTKVKVNGKVRGHFHRITRGLETLALS